jgi:hypothetical protein
VTESLTVTDLLMLFLILDLFDDFHIGDFGFSFFDVLNLSFTFNWNKALLSATTILVFRKRLISKPCGFFFEVLNLLAFMDVKQISLPG